MAHNRAKITQENRLAFQMHSEAQDVAQETSIIRPKLAALQAGDPTEYLKARDAVITHVIGTLAALHMLDGVMTDQIPQVEAIETAINQLFPMLDLS